jgi:hypothetical protein
VSEDDGSDRVLFEMSYYSDNKDAVKAPLKELGLDWQFLGRESGTTKGRYSGDGVSVFVMYTDDHADFTVQGDDGDKRQRILDAWSDMPTVDPEEAGPRPGEGEEPTEVRVWKFKEPTRRPGEPEALYERRLAAWEEDDPRD